MRQLCCTRPRKQASKGTAVERSRGRRQDREEGGEEARPRGGGGGGETETRQRGNREDRDETERKQRGDLPIIKSGANVEMVCHRLALLELPAVEVNDVAHLPR
jgi:hypothetical protein